MDNIRDTLRITTKRNRLRCCSSLISNSTWRRSRRRLRQSLSQNRRKILLQSNKRRRQSSCRRKAQRKKRTRSKRNVDARAMRLKKKEWQLEGKQIRFIIRSSKTEIEMFKTFKTEMIFELNSEEKW